MASRTRTREAAARRLARLSEASERIADPELIQSKLEDLAPGQKSLLWDLYRKSRRELTAQEIELRRQMLADLQAAADGIEADIYAVFRALGTEEWSLASVRRIGRDKALLDQIGNRIDALGGQLRSTLEDGLIDRFKSAYQDGAYRLDSATPDSVAVRFGLFPDREIAALVNQDFNGGKFSDRLGIITADMAQDIKSQLLQSMMAGESWQAAARRIRGQMGADGARAVWRSEMIARTELTRAQIMANRALHDANSDVIDEVIFIAHPGACDICDEKNGRPVSEVGYPVEDTHPNAVFSGASFAPYGELRQMIGSDYNGPAIELVIGAGPRTIKLSVGPNHPVLTGRGFVAARDLKKSDQVVHDLRNNPLLVANNPDLKKMVATENAFESLFSLFGHSRISSAASYFHGDEAFVYGEIQVVRPERNLLSVLNPGGLEKFCERDLMRSNSELTRKAGFSPPGFPGGGVLLAEPRVPASKPILPRAFEFRPIRTIHKTSFRGRAFDASTATGLYNYGGIVVKNCVCDTLAVPKNWEELAAAGDGSEPPEEAPDRAQWERDNGVGLTL